MLYFAGLFLLFVFFAQFKSLNVLTCTLRRVPHWLPVFPHHHIPASCVGDTLRAVLQQQMVRKGGS